MVEVTNTGEGRALAVEGNGINVISDAERTGRPADLFWPWFGANVSVLGLSYGAFTLGFGISFWQAVVAGVVGILFSFLLCGVVALAGKRGSAPTMVLSRAAFGVRGNKLPTAISWLLTVGWETALTILATLATATVFERLGWGGGTATKVVALLVVAALVVGAGVLGFTVIMRLQTVITIVTGVLTVVFVVLAAPQVDWGTVAALPSGSVEQVIVAERGRATRRAPTQRLAGRERATRRVAGGDAHSAGRDAHPSTHCCGTLLPGTAGSEIVTSADLL